MYASIYIYIYIYIYIFISIYFSDDTQSGTQIALSDRVLFSNPLAALFGHSTTQVMKKKSEEKHERHAKLTHSRHTPLIDARHNDDSYHSRRSWEK